MRNYLTRYAALVLAALLFTTPSPAGGRTLTLAVANSTCTTVQKVGALYQQEHPVELEYRCKASGLLAKGLRGRAIRADVYLSANRAWMDYMVESGLVSRQRVVSPWGNTLAVAARKESPLRLTHWEDLTSPKVKTLLLGDPSTAPFGRYAKEALESTGLWERVRVKVATKKHITLLADTLADGGLDTVGILFTTNIGDELRILYRLDPEWHSPVDYYLAPVGPAADDAEVNSLLKFMQGEAAREVFEAAGFKSNSVR